MRNRQIIEYLIYPRLFNAHSILYKGTYCISFTLYNITKNKTITYAYPFIIKNQSRCINTDLKEEPCVHADGNFSFLTHKFEVIYEEERKKIESQCIFRLQFDLNKNYNVFMNVKLLRKVSNNRPEQFGLCVRKIADSKFEAIDEQVLQIKKDSFNNYERIVFRTSQFFSSIDLYMCNFNYGYKYYRSKMQISNLVGGSDLYLHNPAAKMKEKCQMSEKRTKNQDKNYYKEELLNNFESGLPTYYYELLQILSEHKRLVRQYEQFAYQLSRNQNSEQVYLPQHKFIDLDFIKMNKPVNLRNLEQHYSSSTSQEILGHIFEQKELVRRNLRELRQEFCSLLAFQTQKQFMQMIAKQTDENQKVEESYFVKYVADLMLLEEEPQDEARNQAIQSYTRGKYIWNNKINNSPYFYVQNYVDDRKSRSKHTTLTVFVHGYQGNSFDFQKAKNYLRKYNKHTHILIVESITNDMNQSIQCLGLQAAQQVKKYIDNCIFNFSLINFIGFSLGGIISRAAFIHLKDYWDKFNLFATFSSPHLGISQCQNNLVNIGVWYLIKVDKVKNLKELNFQSVNFNDSVLMKLSRCEGLSQFKKVVLVCSKNDGFVPYYSTVLDQRKCDKKDLKDLCRNITNKISKIQRVEIVFDVQNSGAFDKLTGRKGHIQFLDNDYFLEIFFRLYAYSM